MAFGLLISENSLQLFEVSFLNIKNLTAIAMFVFFEMGNTIRFGFLFFSSSPFLRVT